MQKIGVFEVPVKDLVASRWQPRQRAFNPQANEADAQLVASVKQHGLLNRLLVFENRRTAQWEVIAGHRRLGAAKALGLETVPVEQVEANLDEIQAMVVLENLHHEDLTAIEEARAYQQLMELQGLTQDEVAECIGKTQGHVSQRLSLLGMAPAVQEMLMERTLDSSVAREMVGMPLDLQEAVATRVSEAMEKGQTTSRKSANVARKLREAASPEFWTPPADLTITPAQRNLSRMLVHWIDQARSAGTLARVLMDAMDGGELRHPWQMNEWTADRICTSCGDPSKSESSWPPFAREQGWTCANCQVKGLQLNQGLLDGGYYRCGEVGTCAAWIGPDDPLLLAVDYATAHAGACNACDRIQHLDSAAGWCPDPGCYKREMTAAREKLAEERQSRSTDRTAESISRAAAWLEQQRQTGINTEHWLAQSCARCMNLGNGEACESARHPPQYGPAELGFATAAFGQETVPICSRFRLRSMSLIPDTSRPRAEVLRGILLGLAVVEKRAVATRWLPYGPDDQQRIDPEKFATWLRDQGLDVFQLTWVLVMSLNAANQPGYWTLHSQLERRGWQVINPETGTIERWMLAEAKFNNAQSATN